MVRRSKRREAILRVLKETTRHTNAEWVYEQVRKEFPNISLGTVYRILTELKEEGKFFDLESVGIPARFDARTEPHYHFVCDKCGRIFDLDAPLNKKMDDIVATKTGFKVFSHRGVFYGLCKDCQS